jgi:hypothetical protein
MNLKTSFVNLTDQIEMTKIRTGFLKNRSDTLDRFN